jgi:AcrR family transcriptional regulator
MATLTAEKIIPLIDEYTGNLSMVARKLGVSRTTLYRFLSDKPTVKQALEEAREKMIDNVESKLYSKALAGDTTAMIFFLKTQGKQRGYIERQEVTGADGGPVQTKAVSDEQHNRAISSLANAIGTLLPGAGGEADGGVGSAE